MVTEKEMKLIDEAIKISLGLKKERNKEKMKNQFLIFEGHQVEVFELNGEILFNSKHVAKCLEIADVNSSIRNFNDKQVRKIRNSDVHNLHIRKLNNAGENFLTESGVYKLVFKSHKPNAEEFTDWISDEVLPTLRKTGIYSTKKELNKEKQIELEIKKIKADAMKVNTNIKAFQELKGLFPKKILANIAINMFGVNYSQNITVSNQNLSLKKRTDSAKECKTF